MTEALMTHIKNDRVRKTVDWAVFGIGALSLTIAIGATALSAGDDVAATETTPSKATVLAG